jgi:hypothetical protein
VHILKKISVDSIDEIIRAHCQILGGVQPPRGYHFGFIQSFSEPIFSVKVIRSNLEKKVLSLIHFPGRSVEYSHRASYPSSVAVIVTFWSCMLLIYLCMCRSIHIF